MKALHTLQLCGLAVLSLLASGCSLFPLTPSLTLNVQSSGYTSTPVNIPYSFQTLTRNGDGTANCSYTLSRFYSTSGGYQPVDQNSQTSLQASGTLSFPLTTILNAAAGTPAIDGLYSLNFSVLSENYDQSGNPIPFSFLTKTVNFTVHTFPGGEIFSANPPIVNITNGATPVTFSGIDFTSGGTLTASSASGATVGPLSYTSPQTITASITATTAGSPVPLTYTGAGSTNSSTFYLPAVNAVTVSQILPSTGSSQNSTLPLVIQGSYLGYWSTVTISDTSGHTTTMQIQQVAGPGSTSAYLYGHIDLTPLTPTSTGTLTVTNPDGTSTSVSFVVTS